MKANCDAEINRLSNSSWLGGIIRDYDGEVQFAFCNCLAKAPIPEVAEALALRRIMQINEGLYFEWVIFERDNLVVISAINSKKDICSDMVSIVEDIHFLLWRHGEWKLQFLYREMNMVAYALAKKALIISGECIWMVKMPSKLLALVLNDLQCTLSSEWMKFLFWP